MAVSVGVESSAASAQSYIERAPTPALASRVASVWIQQVAPDAEPYTQRNIPNGGVELLCHVGAVPRIVGPLTRPRIEVLAPGTIVVGVRFHPGAASSLFGLPASELVDLTVSTDALWGEAAPALGEVVAGAASPESALAAVQRELVGRLAGARRPDPVIAQAVRLLMPWGERRRRLGHAIAVRLRAADPTASRCGSGSRPTGSRSSPPPAPARRATSSTTRGSPSPSPRTTSRSRWPLSAAA